MNPPWPLAALLAVVLVVLPTPGEASSAKARPVTISWVGDIAMVASPDGGAGFFSQAVSEELDGDLVIGNLEGTLTTIGHSKCSRSSTQCFAFRAPPSYAGVLERAGFTLMNLANNHAYDYGPQGQADTIAALRAARLRSTGRPGEVAYVRVGSTRIAIIGFAPYSWAQSLTNLASARHTVRRAAARAHVVVCLTHAGAEGVGHQHVRSGTEYFLGENRGDAVAFSHAVVDAGADLVLGSGPHVLRGLEWYRGRVIAYSLGNFFGDGTLSLAGVLGVSGILDVSLRPNGAWKAGELTPIRLVSPGLPQVDPSKAAHGIVRTLSREDFRRGAMRVSKAGKLLPPAWRSG